MLDYSLPGDPSFFSRPLQKQPMSCPALGLVIHYSCSCNPLRVPRCPSSASPTFSPHLDLRFGPSHNSRSRRPGLGVPTKAQMAFQRCTTVLPHPPVISLGPLGSQETLWVTVESEAFLDLDVCSGKMGRMQSRGALCKSAEF